MKTIMDIRDEFFMRAKRHARETGCLPRAVVEEGFRQAPSLSQSDRSHALPDLRAGDSAAADPLEQYFWPELRGLIYGGSDSE